MYLHLIYLAIAVILLFMGHYFKVLRWKQFINIYETVKTKDLLRSLAVGYIINFFLPFRIGDFIRVLLAGKKMKNGFMFSLATVVVDRYLDIICVGIIFSLFYIFGFTNREVADSVLFYSHVSIALIVFSVIFLKYSKYPKIIIKKTTSIFNTKIELNLLFFFWMLISSLKDMAYKINKRQILINTLAMWGLYLSSYFFLAQLLILIELEHGYTTVDIFTILFARSSFDTNTIKTLQTLLNNYSLILCVYLLSPLIILYISSMIIGHKAAPEHDENKRINILPHTNERDKLDFLEAYFTEDSKEYINLYLNLNREINILQDYSAGSRATTLLCMDAEKNFYRKYAFGKEGEKLHDQICWINEYNSVLKLPTIINQKKSPEYCCYDMEYDGRAIGMFNFCHSMPVSKSWQILKAIFNDLTINLYAKKNASPLKWTIIEYIEEKALKNLNIVLKAREFRSFFEYDEVIINGIRYKNINYYLKYLTKDYLYEVFSQDTCSGIHGDLTIENIVCLLNEENGYYLIDPNTGNILSSPNLDFAKLLQSLHGGYEFLTKVTNVRIEGNRVDYIFTKSVVYEELYKKYNEYLFGQFDTATVKSIYFHEIVHWLRLMPYKIEKNGKRAFLFLCGFIIVLNEIISAFEDRELYIGSRAL